MTAAQLALLMAVIYAAHDTPPRWRKIVAFALFAVHVWLLPWGQA